MKSLIAIVLYDHSPGIIGMYRCTDGPGFPPLYGGGGGDICPSPLVSSFVDVKYCVNYEDIIKDDLQKSIKNVLDFLLISPYISVFASYLLFYQAISGHKCIVLLSSN